jgi:hypothetical protein
MSDYEKELAEVLATPGGDLEGVQSRNLEKLKAFVGDDRAQQFLNCHDPDYVEALGFLSRFNLPPGTINDLFKLRVEREKLILDDLKRGLPPPKDPAVSETYRTRLKELLGPEPGEIYIREAKGASWLRDL